MKHPAKLLAAVFAAAGGAFLAPPANAGHVHNVKHYRTASSYACIKNDSKIDFAIMSVSYQTKSGKWRRSPWSKEVKPGGTTCVSLKNVKDWSKFYVKAKGWGTSRIGGERTCGSVFRSEGDHRNREYPIHTSYTFKSRFVWKRFQTEYECTGGPFFWNFCDGCKYKNW